MNLDNKKRDEIDNYLSQDIDTLFSTLSLIESSKNKYLKYLPGQELKHGIQIFNANSKSNLEVFQKCTIDQAMKDECNYRP